MVDHAQHLGGASGLFPRRAGYRGRPIFSAPAGIKPEWYFLATFEFLKYMPAHVGPMEGEEFGLLLISIGFLLWCFVPWIDRGKNPRLTTFVMGAGVAIIVFLTIMTYLGHSA